jgi:predicted phosphodiesterase
MLRSSCRLFQVLGTVSLLAVCVVTGWAQSGASQTDAQPSSVSRQFKATFIVHEADLQKPATVIAYGDMRFTDPTALPAENVNARRALGARVAEEKPDAVLLNGDLTMRGGNQADYGVYRTETQAWHDVHLRIFPVLGNHEFAGCEVRQCLRNWWEAFPALKAHRWYSVELGTKLFVIGLDSNDSLLPGSPQHRWLETQIASLPKSFQFVFITLHHEPVGDVQKGADDNPRPNEMALADLLKNESPKSHAKFVVIAGHIHNYERFERDGVAYLVSGGGGAPQQTIERNPTDLFRENSYPNFHYVKFEYDRDSLKATMFRLADPAAPAWEVKDTFNVEAKTKPIAETQKP